MRNEEQLHIITEILREECRRQSYTMKKLLLFGSRATGNEKPDSDWDFLIVIEEALTRNARMSLWLPMDTSLSSLGIAADIIIKSESDYQRDRVTSDG